MTDAGPDPKTTEFRIWGCRGSRGLPEGTSRIGVHTSCYSVIHGTSLVVFDAGRGLVNLARSMQGGGPYSHVRRVDLVVSHAHVDHWEGLKDAEWFWTRSAPLEVHLWSVGEAVQAIRRSFSHPTYVPLELLSSATGTRVRFHRVGRRSAAAFGVWSIETLPLRHHSGEGRSLRALATAGSRLTAPDGAVVTYMCDHQPSPKTTSVEDALLAGSGLAVCDGHFCDWSQHAHGHGSQESVARLARRHPGSVVLASHHGPRLDDQAIRAALVRHRRGVTNYDIAREGDTYRFDSAAGQFLRVAPGRPRR